ncbi:glycerophosphodiester phosphodiesterase family protein [Aminobacter sp. NyZ550]|uniref:glycerophosphodiester phosphodiesterase family protein n=1 Tax=Aminobacter sp. NyZ550 TaxID=2979870 RepID=UPI0021D605B8|nr:glycerophosphodiester phosphodiesterase family protein [Aminobacter sp. NyZ550]WAX93345.1 glycerophosphodiester phosphodiesterase family protein [Aminobacter sp. NyZ550]
MRKRNIILLLVVTAAGAVYLNNTSLLSDRAAGKPVVLAHRGLAQEYDRTGLTNDTCTAERMLPPRHDYLENTVRSMDAAFRRGADVLELDMHPTTDGKFAVFHDWTVDCRTEGNGETRSHSMADLKKLDVGYGYTADGGKTYPFRGQGVGLMPSLDEVMERFPGRRFHINVKSNDAKEGEALAAFLSALPRERQAALTIVGGDRPLQAVKAALPDMRTLSKKSLTRCLLRYAGLGWSGYVPEDCRGTTLGVPINFAPWLWGWPDRFLDRMESAGTNVYLFGPYHGGGFSDGIDDPAIIETLPAGYSGGISTDALELVMPALERRSN